MTIRRSFNWEFLAASIAMFTALITYLLIRVSPPELLAPFSISIPPPTGSLFFWGWAPSFFYTLSLCLLLACVLQNSKLAARHCVIWTFLSVIFEISQYPLLATPISKALESNLLETSWIVFAPYWTNGTFDPLDILATITGGGLGFTTIRYLQRRKIGEC